MRVLVTGGAGFIGSNAAARYASEGHDVLVFDNLSRKGSPRNALWLHAEHGVTTEQASVCDGEAVRRVVDRFAPDLVLHCAGQVAVTRSVQDPRQDFEANALGTFNVLEALRVAAPEAILLYASTNKVYGALEDMAVQRDGNRWTWPDWPDGCPEDRPLDFHSPYGCSKGAADQYVRDYARIYGLRTVVLRQSCIYGYRQHGVEDQGWMAWFTIRSIRGAPVTIYGDGFQVRDVLFVDDLLDAYAAAVASIDVAAGQVYNVGGGPDNTFSLRELVSELETLNGRPVDVVFAEWRPGDQRVFVCDLGRAKRDLGWIPRVTARDGLRRLHRWVSENLDHLPR